MSPKRVELDRSAIRLKGLEYLSKVKETVKSHKMLPAAQMKDNSASLPKIKMQTSYKDYLKEMPSRLKKKEDEEDQLQSALTERQGKWA